MVSACLLGENCKYNGGNNRSEEVLSFLQDQEVIPVCPEVLGGLSTPRIPCEIVEGKVTNRDGETKDAEFRKGAQIALEKALSKQADFAILQSRSPSCGVKQIYDGTFSGTLKDGSGVFATLLKEKGIPMVDAENLIKGKTKPRIVNQSIALIPYYPWEEATLPWYQDPVLVKQVDNKDELYTPEKLNRMYTWLNEHGNLWYIVYHGHLAGDISIGDNGEIGLAIAPEYQNKHIGRRCVAELLTVAREKGLPIVKAQVYSFNEQSRKMFLSAGFVQMKEDWLICEV